MDCYYKLPGFSFKSGILIYSTIIFIVFLFSITLDITHGQTIDGEYKRCDNEGEEVNVTNITDKPCYYCECINSRVKCFEKSCPRLDGCHIILFDKPSNVCCDVCKGCIFNGTLKNSGQSWVDEDDPCSNYHCEAGVITKSTKTCAVHCKKPKRKKGQCCPICRGCRVKGKTYEEGDTFPSPVDSCATCVCRKGKTRCERTACPVLNCAKKYMKYSQGSCCPTCKGSRKVWDLGRRRCLLQGGVYTNTTYGTPDSCTSCQCLDGTMNCQRKQCPPLQCPLENVMASEFQCCPKCVTPKKDCTFRKEFHKHGTVWNPDVCTNCSCDDGVVRCFMEQCQNEIITCPKNTKMTLIPGKCCSECVDVDAVCAVFGDPHYRTFDGRIYNFQGTCNYILAQDCASNQFSVRVRNDARLTNDFAWTKALSVIIGNTLIYLLQNFRVKVNRERIRLPYTVPGYFDITRDSHTVTLAMISGVKVIWDGDSYLEVSVPPTFKSKMCGLCGNYNNLDYDDLLGRDGRLYLDPDLFGQTWKVGKKATCTTATTASLKKSPCTDDSDRKLRAERECSILYSPLFSTCWPFIDVEPYYKSCIIDMCDCPKRKHCACEAMTAYSRACSRFGAHVAWRVPEICAGSTCPSGSDWKECASACPSTCDNWNRPMNCNKPCIPGCVCKPGLVQQNDKCVEIDKCPVLDNTLDRTFDVYIEPDVS